MSHLRDAVGATSDDTVVLYHGAFSKERGIEELAEAMTAPGLEAAHLALLGVGPTRPYLETIALDPRFDGRIHVLDAVTPDVLPDWISGADVDVIAIQRSSLNHYLCTPNKLWESLTAGVPVVVSDFPTMSRVVRADTDEALGSVCDPAIPASIAGAILSIIDRPHEERARLRTRCRQSAHDRWNWETESAALVDLYTEIEDALDRRAHRPMPGEPGLS
jgi:glycosyltransferase involved in cell wall biosynthesis